MNALAISLQTYFTTFAHTQRDLSVNTIASYRDTWRMLLKYLTTTLATPTRQQQQNPQRPTHRDPRRARPGPARPSRARRHHHPGPSDPTQTHNQAHHRVPHPRRGRRTTGRTRPHYLDRATRPRPAGHDRADRTADQRDLLTDPRRHPPRRRPAHRLHRQRASPTHHPADPSHREHHDDLPR